MTDKTQSDAANLSKAGGDGTPSTNEADLKAAADRNAKEAQLKDPKDESLKDPKETRKDHPTVDTDVKEFTTSSGHDQVIKQHELVDQTRADRDAANEEGHAKNMEAIAREGEEVERNNEDFIASGKEDNRNTPIVHADGSKSWT